MKKVLVLPGDGPGPVFAQIAQSTINATTDKVEFVESPIGRSGYELTGLNLPHETMDLTDEYNTIMSGPVLLDRKDMGTSRDPLHTLKIQLDLYATIRNYIGLIPGPGKDMEVSLWSCNSVRGRDVVEDPHLESIDLIKYVNNSSYRRMMERAGNEAKMRNAKKVACVVNDEMFPESSRMFKEVFDQCFDSNTFDINHLDIDSWASWMVRHPGGFDTVVCVDLYGSMAGGILSGLMGGIRLTPCVYAGDETTLVELAHTVDPLADNGHLNPTSAIMGACMVLQDLEMMDECQRVYKALRDTYSQGELTPDMGGDLTTVEFADAVIRRI